MKNDKMIKFVERLSELTKNEKIDWIKITRMREFDEVNMNLFNEHISDLTSEMNDNFAEIDIILKKSYYSKYKNGYVFVLNFDFSDDPSGYSYVAVQSEYNSDVIKITTGMSGEITRLTNLIEMKISNVDSFIDSFFE